MIELPREFLSRTERQLGQEFPAFSASLKRPPEKGVRVNTLKISAEEFEKAPPVTLDGRIEWTTDGFFAKGEGLGKTVEHAAGLYYVQDPSAMAAAPKLGVCGGERVLDLCAAPGGKTGQLAAAMKGEGVLVANEIDRKRALVLCGNLERLGVKNAVVTCARPDALSEYFCGYFDKILVDAPCSGESMFRRDDGAVREWSLQNVSACARRQDGILDSASKMLAGGGRLVYSTCTFAPEEDEEQIAAFLQKHPDYALINEEKLFPHKVRGDGHFVAVLTRRGGGRNDIATRKPTAESTLKVYREWEKRTLNIRIENIVLRGDRLYAHCENLPVLPKEIFECTAGVYLGSPSADRKRFEPSHTLAMSLKAEEAKCVEVDYDGAINYLRGLTFGTDSEDGYRLVTYKNYPLGWCKVTGGTAKNHLPKGVRI